VLPSLCEDAAQAKNKQNEDEVRLQVGGVRRGLSKQDTAGPGGRSAEKQGMVLFVVGVPLPSTRVRYRRRSLCKKTGFRSPESKQRVLERGLERGNSLVYGCSGRGDAAGVVGRAGEAVAT